MINRGRIRGRIARLKYKNIVGNGILELDGKVVFNIERGAKLNINGSLKLGENTNGYNGRSTIVRLNCNSVLNIDRNTRIFYGGDIMLFENACLTIGNSYINSNCTIRVTKKITIGDDCAIACNFVAMDSNFHSINGQLKSEEIIIENHVWVGSNVTILPGVKVGEGAVIAAGAVVVSDVPKNSLVAGVPAKIIKERVQWEM